MQQQGNWFNIGPAATTSWRDLLLVADFTVPRDEVVSVLGELAVSNAEMSPEQSFPKEGFVWVSQRELEREDWRVNYYFDLLARTVQPSQVPSIACDWLLTAKVYKKSGPMHEIVFDWGNMTLKVTGVSGAFEAARKLVTDEYTVVTHKWRKFYSKEMKPFTPNRVRLALRGLPM